MVMNAKTQNQKSKAASARILLKKDFALMAKNASLLMALTNLESITM